MFAVFLALVFQQMIAKATMDPPPFEAIVVHSQSRFFRDAIEIDNNAIERAIRPVAQGRNSWLFVASERGGHAAAALYSLIESAKANSRNPYVYLRDADSAARDQGPRTSTCFCLTSGNLWPEPAASSATANPARSMCGAPDRYAALKQNGGG